MRFVLFVTAFSLLYSMLHAYAFIRAKQALSFGLAAAIPLAVFMLLMVFCVAIVHFIESLGLETAGRIFAYVGYVWMGLLFLFVCAGLVMDIYRLLITAAQFFLHKKLSILSPSPKAFFFIALVTSVSISAYGLSEALHIRTEQVTLKTLKIPEKLGKLRIVQITDVHLGLIVREARLEKILKTVKQANPDILVSTGDLVDGQLDNLAGLVKLFQGIQPRYGKFAVPGNHEHYAGIDRALNFTSDAGFTILRGKGTSATDFLTMVGVDDPAGRFYVEAMEKGLLMGYPRQKFTILLKHRPVVDQDAVGLFDLQLSGHGHKGQIFPFVYAVKAFFPCFSGLYDFHSGSYLYVSRGSGTWGPPIRFLSPPEVTVIDIVPEEFRPARRNVGK